MLSNQTLSLTNLLWFQASTGSWRSPVKMKHVLSADFTNRFPLRSNFELETINLLDCASYVYIWSIWLMESSQMIYCAWLLSSFTCLCITPEECVVSALLSQKSSMEVAEARVMPYWHMLPVKVEEFNGLLRHCWRTGQWRCISVDTMLTLDREKAFIFSKRSSV